MSKSHHREEKKQKPSSCDRPWLVLRQLSDKCCMEFNGMKLICYGEINKFLKGRQTTKRRENYK